MRTVLRLLQTSASSSTLAAAPVAPTARRHRRRAAVVLGLRVRSVEAASAVCADLDSPAVPVDAYQRCRMDAVAGAILMLRRPPAAAAVVSS